MDNLVQLNEMLIDRAARNGGYSRRQLAAVGILWPPAKGWKKTLVGKKVSRKAFDVFFRTSEKESIPPAEVSEAEKTNELREKAWEFALSLWNSKLCSLDDSAIESARRIRTAFDFISGAMVQVEKERRELNSWDQSRNLD
jgi:hypothetical protein